jgi:hypothetical protein
MSQQKPMSELWLIGEGQLRWGWLHRIQQRGSDFILLEDESRSYLLRSYIKRSSPIDGVVFIGWFREPLSDYQRATLLLAREVSSSLYVLLCNTQETHQYQRDREIASLREQLSSLGFHGDEAFILCEVGLFPSEETTARLVEEMSQQAPLQRPIFFDAKKRALEELRTLIRPVTILQPIPTDLRVIYQEPLQTQLGGMPYLEEGEEWPGCPACKNSPMASLMQVKSGDSLYVIYACGQTNQHADAPSLAVKYYQSPQQEKRAAPAEEARIAFSNTGAPLVSCAFKGTIAEQLPSVHDVVNGSSLEVLPLRVLLEMMHEDNPKMSKATLYASLCKELGVSPVTFSFGSDVPLQLGGYSDVEPFYDDEPCLTGRCESCGRLLQTLVNLHWLLWLNFPWRYTALQFFICPCSPEEVMHYALVGDEPYE